jgi:hypothetical protein
MQKICTDCNISKPISDFYLNKKKNNGKGVYFAICKVCSKIKSTIYLKNNPEIFKTIRKKHYNKNKETIKQYSKIYYNENKNKYRLLNKELYKNNINNKIRHVISTRINKALKNNKDKHTIEYTYCSINYLKQHIESQFRPEMNWNNHGVIWEIDHIKPCALFDLSDTEQQKQCFHYSNLQPLFKTTEIAESFGYNETGNRNKGGNII